MKKKVMIDNSHLIEKKKKEKYLIAMTNSVKSLEKVIQNYVNEGYLPTGTIFVDKNPKQYCQALILKTIL